jgi:hypothetical protein
MTLAERSPTIQSDLQTADKNEKRRAKREKTEPTTRTILELVDRSLCPNRGMRPNELELSHRWRRRALLSLHPS